MYSYNAIPITGGFAEDGLLQQQVGIKRRIPLLCLVLAESEVETTQESGSGNRRRKRSQTSLFLFELFDRCIQLKRQHNPTCTHIPTHTHKPKGPRCLCVRVSPQIGGTFLELRRGQCGIQEDYHKHLTKLIRRPFKLLRVIRKSLCETEGETKNKRCKFPNIMSTIRLSNRPLPLLLLPHLAAVTVPSH